MPEPTPRIKASALPDPTYLPQDPTKKSHARRQPKGHVPRPRNAFILFRCDFVRQKKVPEDVENDHRNISRIAGSVWREMTDEDKAPWVLIAEKEKAMHSQVYPGYRYSPHHAAVVAKRKKRGDVTQEAETSTSDRFDTRMLRRSSSCPLPDLQMSYDGQAPTIMAPPQRYLCQPSTAPRITTHPPRNLNTTESHRSDLFNPRFDVRNFRDLSSPRRVQPILPDLAPTRPVEPRAIPTILPIVPSEVITDPHVTTDATNTDIASLTFLRRPSSCPPGAQRISSAQLDDPSGTCAFQMTRDDLSRRPSRITMYQSSPVASGFHGGLIPASAALPSPFVRDLGRNTRPLLQGGPYRIDPPHDAPGWDACPPEAQPWNSAWRNEESIGLSALNYMGMEYDIFGGIPSVDLYDISLEGFEGISQADIDEMQQLNIPGTHPQGSALPQFTNPFSLTALSPSNYLKSTFASGSNPHPESSSHFDFVGPGTLPLHPKPTVPRSFPTEHDALVARLFPRMSLDDEAAGGITNIAVRSRQQNNPASGPLTPQDPPPSTLRSVGL